MKFDSINKFDLYYYGQLSSLRLKLSSAWKRASNTCAGTIYFAGDGTCTWGPLYDKETGLASTHANGALCREPIS